MDVYVKCKIERVRDVGFLFPGKIRADAIHAFWNFELDGEKYSRHGIYEIESKTKGEAMGNIKKFIKEDIEEILKEQNTKSVVESLVGEYEFTVNMEVKND